MPILFVILSKYFCGVQSVGNRQQETAEATVPLHLVPRELSKVVKLECDVRQTGRVVTRNTSPSTCLSFANRPTVSKQV